MARLGRVPGSFWGKAIGAGIVGGIGMGLYEMIATAAMGRGFWSPLNMIGATIPAYRPPAMTFAAGPTLVGLLIHMMVSAIWGLIFASLAASLFPRAIRDAGRSTIGGLVLGVVVWVVTGLLIGPAIDPALRLAPPLHYFIGHLVYGLITAWLMTAWTGTRELAVTFAPEEAAIRRGRALHR